MEGCSGRSHTVKSDTGGTRAGVACDHHVVDTCGRHRTHATVVAPSEDNLIDTTVGDVDDVGTGLPGARLVEVRTAVDADGVAGDRVRASQRSVAVGNNISQNEVEGAFALGFPVEAVCIFAGR